MKEFRFAIGSTIPIFFTYLFIGIAFGILMSDAGYSVLLGKEYFLIPALVTCLVALVFLRKPIEQMGGFENE